jgi:excisionase family DNA binding protein
MANKPKQVINRLLTGSEIASILNVSKAFAYQLMRNGEIPTVRLGRAVRVRPEDLQAFVKKNLTAIGCEEASLIVSEEPGAEISDNNSAGGGER